MTEQAEGARRPERVEAVSPHFGAIFKQGREGMSLIAAYGLEKAETLITLLDVKEETDRELWALKNLYVFSGGILPSPEERWKGVIDSWLIDLGQASATARNDMRKEGEPGEKIKDFWAGVEKTELDIKAMMAVSASARAMEQSGGSAAKYGVFITLSSREPNLDRQDSWAEFLLHKDPDKLYRVINKPLVHQFYDKVMEDAGIIEQREDPKERGEKDKWLIPEEAQAKDQILTSKLVECLKDKNKGFDGYISEVLLSESFIKPEDREKMLKGEEIDDTALQAAAKLAVDAFLVDRFTQWEYDLDQYEYAQKGNKKGLRLLPFPGWGGNPLRAILEPSFLPKRIKGVYPKDLVIHGLTDRAFRPEDLVGDLKLSGEVREMVKGRLPKPTMTENLKNYLRWSGALWVFFGGSRGNGIPQWNKETLEGGLSEMVELLDQVYGAPKDEDPFPNAGKHLMAVAVSRILQCKALALALESARPGFRDNIDFLFGTEEARPFRMVEEYIWGPHLDSKKGFLASLAGGRTRMVFKPNRFGREQVENVLLDTYDILDSNDQDPKGRGKRKAMTAAAFVLRTLIVLGGAQKGQKGR